MKKFVVIFLAFFICFYAHLAAAMQENPYPFTSSLDANRFDVLTKEIRCVVCQNQSISDSNAPLANDLRGKVYHMVLDKKSNDEIKAYLVKRYGQFILLKPLMNSTTAILWLFPIIGLGFALLFLYRFVQRASGSR